ncbi:MAG: hypothetical protein Q9217_005583 [Psora testacea]
MPMLSTIPSEEVASKEYDSILQSNTGLGGLFYGCFQRAPHNQAVIEGDKILSYLQLHCKASRLAKTLQNSLDIQPEEPIGILVSPGTGDVIAQVAVLYTGGSCVPLDPSLPQQQLEARLKDVSSRGVIVDAENQHRLPNYHMILLDHEGDEYKNKDYIPVSSALEKRTHLLYTSGTTGNPKTVQITGRAITHVACHLPPSLLDPSDRLAHVNSSTFDISMFEIWAPLLRGATIVILDKRILLDPFLLAESIDLYGLTHLSLTAAVLNLVSLACPGAFSRLKMLTTGGEAPSRDAIGRVLENGPPGQLINCYGPTECTMVSLVHRLTSDNLSKGEISIGKPLGRTLVLILDESLSPVPNEQIGEAFIGGDGVSPGYLNQHEKNAKSFLSVGGLSQSGAPTRLYRTGDLVRRRNSGLIEYCGRRDNQVKIRGYRVELEAVEAALMATGQFSAAVALKIDQTREGAGAVLAAYVVPLDERFSGTNALDEVTNSLHATLPSYMVPHIEIIDQLPLNSHGKVDRKMLANLKQEMQRCRVMLNGMEKSGGDTVSKLKQAWLNVLAITTVQLDLTSDFFKLGGTSLQAAVLIQQIRQDFDVEISSLALYDNSDLAALASLVEESKKGDKGIKDETEVWQADALLGEEYCLPPGSLRDWRCDIEGRAFVTGVTGFVGAHFLRKLLEMPCVLQVGCLVRAHDPMHGLIRIRRSLEKYQLWEDRLAWKLLVFPGNLVDEHFGLGQDRFDAIAEWASVVFHLGAHVNYTQPYSVHRPSNVIGTLNVLRFVSTGRVKALHYVSSISAFGPSGMINGVTYVSEDDPLQPHLNALPYDHGYSQSQWVAEQMLWSAIRRGFPIAIYRPGFVTGSSSIGLSNPDDFLSRLMTACLSMGSYPLLPNQRKEFVTVDWVTSAILHISSHERNLGHAYHLVPQHTASTDMQETFRLISLNGFPDIQGLPYADWVERLKHDTHERLLPLLPMLQEKVYNGLTRWEMYENMPKWGTENTRRALADRPEILNCRQFDADLAALYLKQWDSLKKGGLATTRG